MQIRTVGTFLLSLTFVCPFVAAAATHSQVPDGAGQGADRIPASLVAALAKVQSGEAAHDPKLAIGSDGCATLDGGHAVSRLRACFDQKSTSFSHEKQKISLDFVAWGHPGAMRRVESGQVNRSHNRVDFRSPGISQWWRVLPMGYEQGFTIDKAPAGNGRVVIDLKASQSPSLDHGNLHWGALRYGKLLVTDASGKVLPAQLQTHGRHVLLGFDASRATFPVTVDPVVWLQQELSSPVGDSGDSFGIAIAVSADGKTALVGAPQYGDSVQPGHVYVYTRSNQVWTLSQTLSRSSGVEFGKCVALSANGNTALIGSGGEAFIFTRSGSVWQQAAQLSAGSDAMGYAVSLADDGQTALVGARGSSGVGAAYVFSLLNNAWTQVAKLVPSDTQTFSDGYANNLVLSADGTKALVDAPGRTVNGVTQQGEVYAFAFAGGGWAQTQALTAGNTQADEYYGSSLAISGDGQTAMVGSPVEFYDGAEYGAVHVYTASGNTWSPSTVIKDPNEGLLSSDFGESVAMTSDGQTALIGKKGDDNLGGAIFIFKRSNDVWTLDTALHATGSRRGSALYGTIVAVSADGSSKFIGTPGYVYIPTQASFSTALSAPSKAGFNKTFTSQYIVTNDGATPTGPVTVNMTISFVGSEFASFQSVDASQGTCSYDSGTLTASCSIGEIPANGGTTTVSMISKSSIDRSGTFQVTGDVFNASPDVAQTASVLIKPASPTISNVSNISVSTNSTGKVSFTLSGTGQLLVTATVSNPSLFTSAADVGSSCNAAGSCTVTFKTAAGGGGTSNVKLTVQDTYGQSSSTSFVVTVQAPTSSGGGGGGGALGPILLLLLASFVAGDALRRRQSMRSLR